MISAYQSHLFNRYLAQRIEVGLFEQLLAGDVCKKADTGGMFEVQDAAAEQPRYARGEITFTGPIYGKKMWAAQGPAAELEARILAEAELTEDDLRRVHTDGTRGRPACGCQPSSLPRATTACRSILSAQGRLCYGGDARVHEIGRRRDQFVDVPDEYSRCLTVSLIPHPEQDSRVSSDRFL